MPLFAQYIATDDLVFTGADFCVQWQECSTTRSAYAYLIPLPEDPTWPDIEAYFSAKPFTKRELRQLCQYDYTPLRTREAKGEPVCGFRWPLSEVALEAVSPQGRQIMQALRD